MNSYGEEVHVAQSVRWENVTDSLPKAELAGIVDAVSVCDGGMKDFILHPARWIKPVDQQVWMKPPAVMAPLDCWEEMVEGLIHRNICGVIPLKEVFHVGGSPILGGIFGVAKGETTPVDYGPAPHQPKLHSLRRRPINPANASPDVPVGDSTA